MKWIKFIELFVVLVGLSRPGFCQVVPDRSLGNQNSQVVPDRIRNLPADRIEGGLRQGQNLFHSFQEFSVPTGRGAYFANPEGIQNIITRITGNKVSEISGTLGVLGSSNLFLLNPQGIIFGQNAQLDLQGGSFIATTGNSWLFENNTTFSATNPQTPPLLAVNVPVGVQFGDRSAEIINRSVVPGEPLPLPIPNIQGIAVPPGKSLALLGGNITNTGGITARSGQVLLGSVTEGTIKFDITDFGIALNYDEVNTFGDISLNQSAQIDTSGLGGGRVELIGDAIALNNARIYGITLENLDGRGISIRGRSVLLENGTQISTLSSGSGVGGSISVEGSETLSISGLGSESFTNFAIQSSTLGEFNPFDPLLTLSSVGIGTGKAGNIELRGKDLDIQNGSIVFSVTGGQGVGGSIFLEGNEIQIRGSLVNSGNSETSSGESGDITVNSRRLEVIEGGILAAANFGAGGSGNITVYAEEVEVSRTPVNAFIPSIITSDTISGVGNAGNIEINTNRLEVNEGVIGASSGGVFGSFPTRPTAGIGGNITIHASESILINRFPNAISTFTVTDNPSGTITLETPRLVLDNQARIISGVVFPDTTGSAGTINITADRILVDNQSSISANTNSGQGGNINLTAQRIELRRNSSISTDAGTSSGGNIEINSDFLLAFPQENSDITANASSAQGGEVTINVPNIFGIGSVTRDQIRDRLGLSEEAFTSLTTNPTLLLPSSDISAISQTEPTLEGVITFNTSGLNPNQSLVELPQNTIDPNVLINTQACSGTARNSFVIRGRGGLPASPQDLLNYVGANYQWIPAAPSLLQQPLPPTSQPQKREPLQVADQLSRDKEGRVTLVSIGSGSVNSPYNCYFQKQK